MNHNDEGDGYLTVRKAAARGQLSERTIWNLIARGILRVARPTGLRAVRIPEREFERVMLGRAPETERLAAERARSTRHSRPNALTGR